MKSNGFLYLGMSRLLVFVFALILLGSCSSKKILSVRKISNNGVINNIASQYDFSQKQYSALNNTKNSSVKNLSEVEASVPTVKNDKDLLASKDKVEPTALINNYSYNSPQIALHEKINKSFLEKVPILKHKEITKKKSITKDNQNKILKLIGTCILIFNTIIIIGITWLIIAFDGLFRSFGLGLYGLLISILFTYLSYKAVKNTIKAFSSENNNGDTKESSDKYK